MTVFTETIHPGAFLVSEKGEAYSRDVAVVAGGQGVLVPGTVLGKRTVGTATSAVKASGANVGNGLLTLDATAPVQPHARVGTYQVRCTAAAVNAATFRVFDPLGDVLGDMSYGPGAGASATFADQVKFAVTDGQTDFAVGDGFDITVAPADGKWVTSPAAATDGTDQAAGVLYASTDTTAGDIQAVVVRRLAEVRATDLTFDPSVNAPPLVTQKIAQLAALGIGVVAR